MFDDVSNLRQLESIAIMCYNKASVTRSGMCIQQTPSGENIKRFPWKGLNQGQKEMLMLNVQLPLIDREYVQISAKKKISILFPFVFPELETTPVRSSGTSGFSAWASNFVFLLAPRARALASRSPTKCLIMIVRRKDKF